MSAVSRVSAIIAVYNGARYLGAAIDSLLAQSCAVDIIVVDDGSTDDSSAVAARFGRRVMTVVQGNLGQPAALNAGIATATSEYLAFLDADDLWERDKAARQLARFDARPDLDYCVTRIRNFLSPEFEGRGAALRAELFADAPGYVVSTLMARKSLFDRIGGFDTGLRHANKTEWFLRARHAGVVGEEIADVLVRRRLHASNRSQTYAQRSVDEYLNLVKASIDRSRRASS